MDSPCIFMNPKKIDFNRTFKIAVSFPEDVLCTLFPGRLLFLKDKPAAFLPHQQKRTGAPRMLNSYMERKIGGVLYKVQSVFAGEGDFQKLYESLLVSRILENID